MVFEVAIFELCAVVCGYCGVHYNITCYIDETPVLCDECHTPSLRVIDREPI